MRGLQKSKRVSWASDVNLCQVRLFLSEECPSQVGLGAQDHLQAKTPWLLHSGMISDDNLPPGFEGTPPANLLKNRLSQVPVIKWKCPSRFVLDSLWQVVSGEESKEVEIQIQREMRVLEAVYPRPSAIPPNPSSLLSMDEGLPSDHHIPLIPITPIEDEDSAVDTPSDSMPLGAVPTSSQPPLAPTIPTSQRRDVTEPIPRANGISAAGMAAHVEPDAVAAAYAALNALMANNDQGNLIDRDLLVKILSEPNLIEQLATSQGAVNRPQIIPELRPPGVALAIPLPPVHVNRTEVAVSSLTATPSGPFYPPLSRVGPVPNLRPPLPEVPSAPSLRPPLPEVPSAPTHLGAPVVKDINYYKSLIQQHGGERQETMQQFGSHHNPHMGANQELVNIPKQRDLKPKIMKPCIYFNSSRGCRHGANCAYQHDPSSQQRVSSMPEVQSAKRMKMDREITGT